jgi:uncharacterized membrane protein (DUF485 family)
MVGKMYNWASIAQNPKFVELQRKKSRFLIVLWLIGVLSYFLLPLGVGYAPEFFKMKVIGRINFAYIFCLYQYVMTLAIALYYTYRANKEFDPLTKEVLEGITNGGQI